MMSLLTGWPAVLAIALAFFALAVLSCRFAMRGLVSTLAVAILSFPAMWLLSKHVFGDVSSYLPAATFSDGSDGKDQIIVAGILCTILGGVSLSALVVALIARLDRALNRRATS